MLMPTGTVGQRPLPRSLRNRSAIASAPIVIKTETIDQRSLLGQSKDARLRISRLRFRGHGADLDKTETKRRPGRKRDAVFVQAGSKSDWIPKVQAEKRFRSRRWLKTSEHSQREIEMRSTAKHFECEMMRVLGIQ